MSFEIEGTLHKKFETEQKTERFQAREFVLKIEDGQYPQFIKFQLVQDRVDIIDPYEVGHQVKVYFDLRGREWNEKYFTNLSAWRVENAAAAAQPQASSADAAPQPATQSDPFAQEMKAEDFDDLPF